MLRFKSRNPSPNMGGPFMLYKPGDIDKIIDTVIALDIACTALFQSLNEHDNPLATTIAKTLKESVDTTYNHFPAEQAAGIADRFRAWGAILTNGSTPAEKR